MSEKHKELNSESFREGDVVLLTSEERKFLTKLKRGASLQTDKGVIKHEDIIGKSPGSQIQTSTGYTFWVILPSLSDLMLKVKRKSQIVYPKDMGYIFMESGIKPGDRVVEVGTGSGSATLALAWLVGDSGKVYSYEKREDFRKLAMENLRKYNLEGRVIFLPGDVKNEFPSLPGKVDFAFIDVPEPWELIGAVKKALKPGRRAFFLLPTWNQVIKLLEVLKEESFTNTQLSEVLVRNFKINPTRVRPLDRMVSHTAFLIFTTLVTEVKETDMKLKKINIEHTGAGSEEGTTIHRDSEHNENSPTSEEGSS